MGNHSCNAVIVTCIDFRFQEYISKWIKERFSEGTYDRIAFAGGVHDSDIILRQIDISHKLHHIKMVVLINHEDCGAYGEKGTYERHNHDLKEVAKKIYEEIPEIEIETYYLHLDGTFEEISQISITEKLLTSADTSSTF